MSRVLNVSENNYKLKVQSGGTITFDTSDIAGNPIGTVIVIGNLDVKGTTTTVESSNTTIKDNILQLNYGQTGNGISSSLNYQSGIQIGRGNYSDAEFVFDDSVSHYDPYTSNATLNGTFVFKTADGNRSGIQVSTITSDGAHNLLFDLKNTLKTLEIVNIDPAVYSAELIDADPLNPDPATLNYIPNKKFIKDYIQSGVISPGMADVDKIYKSVGGVVKARVQAYNANLKFFVNEVQRAQITVGGLDVDNVNLFNNTVTNTSSNNLVITANNNNVEINAVMNLDDQLASALATSGTTKIFSKSQLTALNQTPGRTGIFFANTVSSDELVAKNRALLFSMLF